MSKSEHPSFHSLRVGYGSQAVRFTYCMMQWLPLTSDPWPRLSQCLNSEAGQSCDPGQSQNLSVGFRPVCDQMLTPQTYFAACFPKSGQLKESSRISQLTWMKRKATEEVRSRWEKYEVWELRSFGASERRIRWSDDITGMVRLLFHNGVCLLSLTGLTGNRLSLSDIIRSRWK